MIGELREQLSSEYSNLSAELILDGRVLVLKHDSGNKTLRLFKIEEIGREEKEKSEVQENQVEPEMSEEGEGSGDERGGIERQGQNGGQKTLWAYPVLPAGLHTLPGGEKSREEDNLHQD